MDTAGSNQRYDTTELVWTADPLVAVLFLHVRADLRPDVRARRPGQR